MRNELQSSMSALGEDESRKGGGRVRRESASDSERMSRSARRQHVTSARPMRKRKTTPVVVLASVYPRRFCVNTPSLRNISHTFKKYSGGSASTKSDVNL